MFVLIWNIIALIAWGWRCDVASKERNWASLTGALAMFIAMLVMLVVNIANLMEGM